MISPTKAKAPGSSAGAGAFTLRLNVVACQPRIWRRFLVRESMWLSRLHDTIQIAFDWFDYQTHAFNLDDLRFGNPLKREELTIEDDRDVTLADLDLEHRERFTYGYHFGEGWQIELKVEKTGGIEKGAQYPVCLAGERAGPPEDAGARRSTTCSRASGAGYGLGREDRVAGPGYDRGLRPENQQGAEN